MNNDFGKLLKSYRKSKCLSRQALADKLQKQGCICTKADISKWENDICNPPEDIAKILEGLLLPKQDGALSIAAGDTPMSKIKTKQKFDGSGYKQQVEENQELLKLLEKLRFQVKTETIEINMATKEYRVSYPVERDALFSQLKSRLAETNFNQCLDQCKTGYQNRCKFMAALSSKLNSEAQVKTGLRSVIEIDGAGLELSFGAIMICDTKWSLLEMIYEMLQPSIPPFWKRLTWIEPLRAPRGYTITPFRKGLWELKLGKIPLARGSKESLDNCESIHKDMFEDLKKSSDFATYMASNSNLEVYKKAFESEIDRILWHPALIMN